MSEIQTKYNLTNDEIVNSGLYNFTDIRYGHNVTSYIDYEIKEYSINLISSSDKFDDNSGE